MVTVHPYLKKDAPAKSVRESDQMTQTRIYDPEPGPEIELHPGKLPPDVDPPLELPGRLPQTTPPNRRQRYASTPIYEELT